MSGSTWSAHRNFMSITILRCDVGVNAYLGATGDRYPQFSRRHHYATVQSFTGRMLPLSTGCPPLALFRFGVPGEC
jgi:hypothetical protein